MSSPEAADRTLRDAYVIREPPGVGQGFWAGAPGVFYARDEKAFYVTYRTRPVPSGISMRSRPMAAPGPSTSTREQTAGTI
jgi:hypothetical protein